MGDIVRLRPKDGRPPLRVFAQEDRKPCADPQLNENLSAKLEVFASLAKGLSQEAHSLGHRTIAQTLENINEVMETRSAELSAGLLE